MKFGVAVAVTLAGAATVVAQQTPQFRTGVDVVELNVAVFDGRRVVADLTPANFEVIDNGVKQEVLSATREIMPIDATIVIDTSESVTEPLMKSMLSAINRIRERLRGTDRVSVITFNHRVYERVALLPPPSVRAIEIGRPSGQTSLNDAIAIALTLRAVPGRRRMLIVFTDGFDSTSLLTEQDVLDIAGRSSASVFTVMREMVTTSTASGSKEVARFSTRQPIGFFEELTAVTGGVAQTMPAMKTLRYTRDGKDFISMTRNDKLLDEAFLKALDDFRSSYVLRYSLSGVSRSGWHTVVVNASKGGKIFTVRTRRGYVGGND
jgi:VWFA-related protein